MVRINLHSILKEYCPNKDGCVLIEYKEDLTVKKVLEVLNLNEIAGLALVNGKVVKTDFNVNENDSIELFPIFGGG